MNRSKYQDYLLDSSKLVNDLLYDVSKKYDDFDNNLSANFKILISERLDNKLLKPTIFRLLYEYSGGYNFNKYRKLACAFELINISSYQANTSFDNKVCAYDKEKKDLQFISSYLSREVANQYILELNIEPYIKEKLFFEFSKINEKIYLAQHLDLNVLTVNNFDYTSEDFNTYFNLYRTRCQLGSGYFSGVCASLACEIANNQKQSELVFEIFNQYGTLLHMINDLGDYLPMTKYKNKVYQDSYSDFKNGRLTLPLYLLLNKTELSVDDISIESIKSEILPFIKQSKSIILKEYKQMKAESSKLERNKHSQMIKVLLSTIKSNKYFNQLKEIDD